MDLEAYVAAALGGAAAAAGTDRGFVPWALESGAALRFGLGAGEVEGRLLRAGLRPARYARNAGIIGLEDQLRLHDSAVAVVGCGGIGGYVVEFLVRLGIGRLVLIDPDCFDEGNLNRQLLATVGNLGEPKCEAAASRVRAVNPAVEPLPLLARLEDGNAMELLAGVDAVADALDSIPARLTLARACAGLGLPFVHGAVAGWYGQAATQFPGDRTVEAVYAGARAPRGIEVGLGNPSFTPPLVAAFEAAELCKILLGAGTPLRRRLLTFDLLSAEAFVFDFGGEADA